MKVAIYARYSSDNQRSESIDAQVRAIREYALREGHEVIKEYIDEALSATNDQRPQFLQMMNDVPIKQFNAIIVHKLDRFSRDRYDSAYYKRHMRKYGIRLISVLENLSDSPESIILESVLEGMAEYFSKNLGREAKKGLRENALSGKHIGGIPPLGYDLDEDKRYIVNEKEAHYVRTIFMMYANNASQLDILNELNHIGARNKQGLPIKKSSIHDILGNEKYIGTLVLGKWERNESGNCRRRVQRPADEQTRVHDGLPAIIDDITWEAVQRRMNNNRKVSMMKGTFVLAGLLKCGICGYAMCGKADKPKKTTGYIYHGYVCTGKKSHATGCTMKEANGDVIEPLIINSMKDRFAPVNIDLLKNLIINEMRDQKSQTPEYIVNLEKELEDIEHKLSNIVNAIMEMGISPTLKVQLQTLESRKGDVFNRLNEARRNSTKLNVDEQELVDYVVKVYRENVDSLNSGKTEEIHATLLKHIDHINVYPDCLELVFNDMIAQTIGITGTTVAPPRVWLLNTC